MSGTLQVVDGLGGLAAEDQGTDLNTYINLFRYMQTILVNKG